MAGQLRVPRPRLTTTGRMAIAAVKVLDGQDAYLPFETLCILLAAIESNSPVFLLGSTSAQLKI